VCVCGDIFRAAPVLSGGPACIPSPADGLGRLSAHGLLWLGYASATHLNCASIEIARPHPALPARAKWHAVA
jgi:hypothetical protein